ncbi:MAG: hypothetical protein Q9165_005217 [Trypethelium subeluteriae]
MEPEPAVAGSWYHQITTSAPGSEVLELVGEEEVELELLEEEVDDVELGVEEVEELDDVVDWLDDVEELEVVRLDEAVKALQLQVTAILKKVEPQVIEGVVILRFPIGNSNASLLEGTVPLQPAIEEVGKGPLVVKVVGVASVLSTDVALAKSAGSTDEQTSPQVSLAQGTGEDTLLVDVDTVVVEAVTLQPETVCVVDGVQVLNVETELPMLVVVGKHAMVTWFAELVFVQDSELDELDELEDDSVEESD